MIHRLHNTLQRPFSVIIFDIDGVLVHQDKPFSTEMVKNIVTILNKKVYVNLVSGRSRYILPEQEKRGIKGIDEIFTAVKNHPALNDAENLKYLFGFEQNGAAIFNAYSDEYPRHKPAGINFPSMDEGLQKKIWKLASQHEKPVFSYAEFKTHSMALWPRENDHSLEQKELLLEHVSDILIRSQADKEFMLFQTHAAVDINRIGVSKASAVDFYLNAGFKLKQIARVGDSTYTSGNDVPMVMYQGTGDDGGFSVQHYDELDAFPITSLPKAINKSGPEATHWLLQNICYNEQQEYLFD